MCAVGDFHVPLATIVLSPRGSVRVAGPNRAVVGTEVHGSGVWRSFRSYRVFVSLSFVSQKKATQ